MLSFNLDDQEEEMSESAQKQQQQQQKDDVWIIQRTEYNPKFGSFLFPWDTSKSGWNLYFYKVVNSVISTLSLWILQHISSYYVLTVLSGPMKSIDSALCKT